MTLVTNTAWLSQREQLAQDETLLATVEDKVRSARESAGDLTKQARLLYLGMHWWMRGRYGQGPEHARLPNATLAREELNRSCQELPAARIHRMDLAARKRVIE